jgi:RNA polymerase sigma-70 factor (ECF subfamily)
MSSDWDMWHAACQGHEASAVRLVRSLTPQAMGLARQLLVRQEDAEDVVQESFMRLWGSRPSDTRGASLATYFNTIVINRCRSWLVRRRELSTDPDQLAEWIDATPSADVPADPAEKAQEGPRIRAAMLLLPARQRMALAMWAYADADVAQIARSLELDTNAAHQLLHRAKSTLRRSLQETSP